MRWCEHELSPSLRSQGHGELDISWAADPYLAQGAQTINKTQCLGNINNDEMELAALRVHVQEASASRLATEIMRWSVAVSICRRDKRKRASDWPAPL